MFAYIWICLCTIHIYIHIVGMWQLINIPASGKRHLREKKSFFRESFATPSPRPFVCSVHSGATVAAAVALASTVVTAVHLRRQACSSVKRKQVTVIRPCHLRLPGKCGTLQQAPWTFAGLSRIFRETCSKIAQPTLLVCTIPNTGMRINNASISAAHLPVYKGAGRGLQICKCTGCLQEPIAEAFAKNKASFANSIADLSRRDSNKDEWSLNT